MTLQLVRFETTTARRAEVDTAIAEMFAAVSASAPDGVRYLAVREDDAPRYQLMLHLADGVDNPLPSIPTAARFRGRLADWALAVQPPQDAVVLGSYHFV